LSKYVNDKRIYDEHIEFLFGQLMEGCEWWLEEKEDQQANPNIFFMSILYGCYE
jgi:hypothetical protein